MDATVWVWRCFSSPPLTSWPSFSFAQSQKMSSSCPHHRVFIFTVVFFPPFPGKKKETGAFVTFEVGGGHCCCPSLGGQQSTEPDAFHLFFSSSFFRCPTHRLSLSLSLSLTFFYQIDSQTHIFSFWEKATKRKHRNTSQDDVLAKLLAFSLGNPNRFTLHFLFHQIRTNLSSLWLITL